MLYLLEFLDMVPPKIVGGDKYAWSCYGDNARYLDLEKNIDVIFDEETQEIYEISIRSDDDDAAVDSDAIWRSPRHESAYLMELKENRKLNDAEVASKKANVYQIDDIIERVNNLYDTGNIF